MSEQQPVNQTASPMPTASPTWKGPKYAMGADPRTKSSFLAAFLSLVPGLGQIYVGYYKRGFINPIVAGFVISILFVAGNESNPPAYMPICVLFLIFFWLYNIIDAWRRALMYNLTLEGLENIPLPDDLTGPGIQGSLFGGAIIMVVSFAVLLYTRFDMPIEVLEQWWPLVPMAFGAFLIYRAVVDKKAN